MVCPNCGKPVQGGFFCGNCGTKLPESSAVTESAVQAEAPVVQQTEVQPEQPQPVQPQPTQPAPETQPASPQPEVQASQPVQPAPEVQPAPAAAAKPVKKKSAKPFIIVGAVVLGVILLIGGGIGIFFISSSNKYNKGMDAIENEDYEEAYDTFTGLKSFKDSEYWAEYARLEIEYQKFDGLAEKNDFDGIIALLQERADFFRKDAKGKEAKALLEEYKLVKEAYGSKESGEFDKAADKFDSLDLLRDQFGYEANLCRAHDYVDNNEWMNAIADLYGLQIGDLELDYLDDPENSDQEYISTSYHDYGNFVEDPQVIEDIIDLEDEEASDLADTAIMGLWYNYGYTKWMDYDFDEAIRVFEKIKDFPNADYMLEQSRSDLDKYNAKYDEAAAYFENGEYYKAKKIFDSIPFIKDSSDRALECEQPLPETGDYQVDDGGIELNIYAPSGSYSVFIKLYDSDGDAVAQVFIEAGDNTTLWVDAGTYTIKVAYGTSWYGQTDLFGDYGRYTQLLNGSDPEFTFNSGYWYELELQTASGEGNVGSDYLSGADSM